ncbi:lipocalin family protein [Aquimarina sp. I32.4]|uniref:lipocalin family protein n=1 Tax=Aquimarina sp. I32.4 TaxID=2053903 RepID=UPI000CDE61AB|nr:lipocalin family protein [Aquimarina sp. I32.4]
MKKTILVATLFLSALSISCSKDDDDSNADPVVGTWQFVQLTASGDEIGITSCQKKDVLEFSSDGTLKMIEHKSTAVNDTENCDKKTETIHKWRVNSTNNYTLIDSSNNKTEVSAAIFVINNVLTIRTEFFNDDNTNGSTSREYKKI